jgi:signal transduction histidine kinase/ligand-binding sensor domain-containing protein/ActR/RegA family two-component response regulator
MKISFHSLGLKYILLTWGISSFLSVVSGQQNDFQFRHLTVDDGLSHSTVNSIYQDRMGFMWFGTDMGLNKFDGARFTVYKHNPADTSSIPSDHISAVLEDSYGMFWIASGYNGLYRFDRKNEIFHSYVNKPGDTRSISSNAARTLFEDSHRNLWIGTAGGGLNRYNRKSGTFTCYRHIPDNKTDIGSNYITSIAEDKAGYLWLASREGILTRFNPQTNTGQQMDLTEKLPTGATSYNLKRLYIDSGDNIWVASEMGLFVVDYKNASVQYIPKGNTNKCLNEGVVTGICEMNHGVFLIATDHGGLNIYNRTTGTFTYCMHDSRESSISNNQLYSLYKSSDGIVWIGSFHGGINILDSKTKKFKVYDDLVKNEDTPSVKKSVTAICEDAEGNILFGYDGEGMDIYNPKSKTTRHLHYEAGYQNSIPGNCIVALYRDRNNDIWMGTYLNGLAKYNWKTKRFTFYKKGADNDDHAISGNSVWSITEDSEGTLWIGLHSGGINCLDRKTGVVKKYKNDPGDSASLVNGNIHKVFKDSQGRIWVGTSFGLCLYNKATDNFKRFNPDYSSGNGLYGNSVYDIFEDRWGNLWIGTDQALNVFNPKSETFRYFRENNGSDWNSVFSIKGDAHDNLWISTDKGICRFEIKNKKFRHYSKTDGLPGNEFNTAAVIKASDGNFYFGSKEGVVAFNPDSISDNRTIPPVYFTGLKVMNAATSSGQERNVLNKNLAYEKGITLSYRQSFTVSFAALNYSDSRKNQYAYWLEGIDEGWVYIGGKNEVTYTNLSPGKYVLKVKGSNNDGLWNETGASLNITILPPWWKTWWFRLFLYLLPLGLFVIFYYARLVFYKNQQKKLLQLVKERTIKLEEVAASLEEKQEEINSQNEELMTQHEELAYNNQILIEQKQQILDQNAELDRHRNQLEILIEERTRELIKAKEKAEESDRLKSSFLANLSHEVRTPLNAILGFSLLLGEKDLNENDREEYNRIIQSSSSTLLDLINDILDLSKIEAGQMELNPSRFTIGEVVGMLPGIYDLFLKRDDIGCDKQVALQINIPEELLKAEMVSDKLKLTQVISKLMSNALKFTTEGTIEIGCIRLDDCDMYEFYVRDTGIGIRKADQERVFERFRKIEADRLHLHRGTGLGLAISYHLVKLLGGSMRLSSKFGKGSTFYFTIQSLETQEPHILHQPEMTTFTGDADHCTILVAEDDHSNFRYLERLIKNFGLKVLHAGNGKKVLDFFKDHHNICLVLMDIKMPEMDGIEALHEIRKMGVQVPVIAQTAYALADEVVRLQNEGFDGYIAKPIQQITLHELLSKHISGLK